MAKRIDEVWYAYNAKGVKIPPYKSKITKRTSNSLASKVWMLFKENWTSIILTVMFGAGLFIAIMYAMLMLFS
jgi:hypothetical protein|tara:strand:+ start:1905 stop:2123 length:219 start_codon:yes stop_codon:yes gene_type:complete